MQHLSVIYDREFFEAYSPLSPRYADSCRLIAAEIHRRFKPRTVVDWGCGTGLHLAEMARRGSNVLGIDGAAIEEDLICKEVEIRAADITKPVPQDLIWNQYELSLCIDVLEHIHEEHADAALANVTTGADMVILSCAPPNQGGHHHVNEQPRRYWIEKMATLGWEYQRCETGDMERFFLGLRDRLTETWMFHNLCIYLPRSRKRRRRR